MLTKAHCIGFSFSMSQRSVCASPPPFCQRVIACPDGPMWSSPMPYPWNRLSRSRAALYNSVRRTSFWASYQYRCRYRIIITTTMTMNLSLLQFNLLNSWCDESIAIYVPYRWLLWALKVHTKCAHKWITLTQPMKWWHNCLSGLRVIFIIFVW